MLVILVDVPNKVAGVVYRAVDSFNKFKNVYKNTFYAHQTSTSICRADKVFFFDIVDVHMRDSVSKKKVM